MTNKLYSNMSLGHQIDFTRLLGDNQRLQHELSMAHGQINHIRSQFERSIADNNAMREYINRLQRQKQEDINKFIATHQQLYETQLETLRKEMEMITIQKQSSGQSLTQLQKEIEKHEKEKQRVLKQFDMLKDMLKNMEQQSNRTLNAKIEEKQAEILALRKQYDKQAVELEDSNYQSSQFQKKLLQLQAQLKENKNKYETMEKKYLIIRDKSGQRLLCDLQQARSQINLLNKQLLARQEARYSDDSYVYENIKRLHQQISSLRAQITSAKDANNTDQLRYHQKIAQINSEKIFFQAQNLKRQKDFILYTQERDRLKIQLNQCRQKLKQFSQQKEKIQNLEQQIAILKIKAFVLEAFRTSTTFKRHPNHQFSKKDHQQSFLLAIKDRSNIVQVIQQFRVMQSIVDQSTDKLRQEQLKRRQYSKKAKDYKLRWEGVSKRQNQCLKVIERFRSKQQQYQGLVEKLQDELEKAYNMNTEVNDKNHYQLLIAPYQQKLQMATNQILTLQGAVKKMESQLKKIGDAYETSREKLALKITQLQKQNSQMLAKNNNLEKQLLQKQLNSVRGKTFKDSNVNYSQKVAAAIVVEQELRKVREELQNQKQKTQELSATISKLKLQNSTLTSKISQYNHYPEDIIILKNKILLLQSKPSDKSTPVDFSVLYDKIEKCTRQLVSARQQKQKLQKQYAKTISQKQQYYYRILQLQEYLSGVRHESDPKNKELIQLQHENQKKDGEIAILTKQNQLRNQQKVQLIEESQMKNEQVVRLNKENNQLLKQTDKLKEVIAKLHASNSNDREIDLIKKVKELEYAKQLLDKELAQEKLKNISISQKVQTKENQNKDLWNQICGLKISIKQYQSANRQVIRTSISDREKQLQEENISIKSKILLIQQQNEKLKQNNDYNQTNFQQLFNQQERKNKEDKQIFKNQYQIMIKELKSELDILNNQIRRNSHSSEKDREDSRINLLASQNMEQSLQTFNLRAKINRLQEENLSKDTTIQKLQRDLSKFEASADLRSYSDPNQIFQLRSKLQQLQMERVGLKNQVRVLQQQNRELSVNRILKDNHQVYGQVFSNQTFGPSQSLQGIQQLRQPEHLPDNIENSDQTRRRQQILCLLVLAWAEIDNLREEMSRRDQLYQQNYEEYLEKLRRIESHYNKEESESINIGLLKQLQCIHKHLLPLPKYIIKDKIVELSDLGSFTESVTGVNMIESRQVNEDQDSFVSRNINN